MFFIIEFLPCKIVEMLATNYDKEFLFCLIEIFTNLRKCCLQLDNLNKLIFVIKNWLNDPNVVATPL